MLVEEDVTITAVSQLQEAPGGFWLTMMFNITLKGKRLSLRYGYLAANPAVCPTNLLR
jgi:hypothetical protein